MIRLDLCHGASVDRLAGYIGESCSRGVPLAGCPTLAFVCVGCCFSFGLLFLRMSAHLTVCHDMLELYWRKLILIPWFHVGRRSAALKKCE